MRSSLFLVAAASCLVPLIAHADILGDSIHATFDFPTASATVLDFGNVTVPGTGMVPGGIATFNIGANQISITDNSPQIFVGGDFNGFEFTDLSKDPGISGVSVDPLSTLTAGQFTFTSNEVFVNFSGIGAVNPGQTLILDLSFAPPVAPSTVTPEPSSIALLGTGLLGVAGTMRRRFAKS